LHPFADADEMVARTLLQQHSPVDAAPRLPTAAPSTSNRRLKSIGFTDVWAMQEDFA